MRAKSSYASWVLVSILLVVAFLLQALFPGALLGLEGRRSSFFKESAQTKFLANLLILLFILIISFALSVFIRRINFAFSRRFHFIALLSALFLLLTPTSLKIVGIASPLKLYMDVFRIGFMPSIFADLRIILTGIGCSSVVRIGDPIVCASVSDGAPAWIYPSTLLYLRRLGISQDITVGLGVAFVISFTLALLLFISRQIDFAASWALLIFLLSPASFLLLERMNLDVVIVTLLLFAALIQPRRFRDLFMLTSLFIASLSKYYALASFSMVWFIHRTKLTLFLYGSTGLFLGYILIKDLAEVRSALPNDMIGSFGWRNTICLYLGCQSIEEVPSLRSTLLLIAICSLLFLLFGKRIRNDISCLEPTITSQAHVIKLTFFIISAPPVILFWTTTSNYWYRLVISIICYSALVSLMKSHGFLFYVFVLSIVSAFFPMGTFANVTNLCLTLLHFIIILYYLNLVIVFRERKPIF